MKISLLLFTLALLALAAALVIPLLLSPRGQSLRLNRHARVRPFSFLERLAMPCVLAMSVLATSVNGWFAGGGNRIALANAILTHPKCGDTLLADEIIGRFALIKLGSDIYHAALCDKGDIPLGFTRDGSAPAIGDRFAFDYFGLSHKGTEATASGAVTAGHLVCPGDNGTVRDVTLVATETVYVCGLAVTTAATTEKVVIIPFAPVQRVIA